MIEQQKSPLPISSSSSARPKVFLHYQRRCRDSTSEPQPQPQFRKEIEMGTPTTQPQPQPQQKSPIISSSSSEPQLQWFTPKSIVEVKTNEKGLEKVYFEATVISISPPPTTPTPTPKKRRRGSSSKQLILVEYHNLLARDEEDSEPLKEWVDISLLRPEPPKELTCKLNDNVDAFYKDDWWTGGVVTRVVERGHRFIVTFQDPPDELEFRLPQIRVHWDWVANNGTWIRPEKKTSLVMFDVGRKVEVSLDAEEEEDNCRDKAWFPATIQQDFGNGAFLAEYSKTDAADNRPQITVDSLHVRPSPPLFKEKTFDLLEKVDAYFDFAWWSGVIKKKLEGSNYVVSFKQMKRDKEFHQSKLRPYLQWKDGKWFISSQDSLISPSEDVMPEHSSGNTVAVPVNNVDNGKDTVDGNYDSSVNLRKDLSEQSTPATLRSSQTTTSLAKRIQHPSHSRDVNLQPHKKHKKGNMHRASQQDTHDKSIKEMLPVNNTTGSATQTVTGDQSDNLDSKLSETGEVSAKRKRGRPRKSLIENLPTLIVGNAQNVASDDLSRIDSDPQRTPEVTVTVTGMEASLPNKKKTGLDELKDEQAKIQSGCKNQKGSTRKQTLANKHAEKVVENAIRLTQQRRSAERGKRQNTDSSDASGRKTIRANCIGEVVEVDPEAPCNEFDKEPPSKWIEGMHPSSIVDGSKTSPANNIEECTVNNQTLEKGLLVPENGNDKLPETGEQASGSIDRVSVDPSDQQNLPFVKNDIFWETIDSTEVFQRIPQRPHFQPLEQHIESLREGMAIGCMITFRTEVKKVSGLQLNDAKSITDGILETLAHLESHGFDVSVVRERVTRLVALKDEQGKFVDNVNEFNSEISVHNRKKSRIEEEINDINQQIQKLQEKLNDINQQIQKLQEKLLLSESTKKEEDVEIANLQAKWEEAKENIKNAEQTFVDIASATLV